MSPIRAVEPGDLDALIELVHLLAEYEREPDAVEMTAAMLGDALFCADPKLFGHVAVDDSSGEVVGMALWFCNFSTWKGRHGLYLEDLFVRPDHRGRGIGQALLAELAAICVARGYGRLEWSVLDWNTPATDFYRSLGAIAMDGWTTFRLTGEALAHLGTRRATP